MGTIISILREFFNYWSYNDSTKAAGSPDVQLQASENDTKEADQRQILLDDPGRNGGKTEQELIEHLEKVRKDCKEFRDALNNPACKNIMQRITEMILRAVVDAGDDGVTSDDVCKAVGEEYDGFGEIFTIMMLTQFEGENIFTIGRNTPNGELVYKLNRKYEVIFEPNGIVNARIEIRQENYQE